MKTFHWKRAVVLGVVCVLLLVAASWYSVTYNEARLVVPMDFSTYVFRVQDLPMLLSLLLLILYLLYLVVQVVRTFAARSNRPSGPFTRTVNPKLGLLGFLGFLGFFGFWTYSVSQAVFPFVFFLFFGFFGFFYEGKLSHTLMDERFRENRRKASAVANRTALSIIFLATLILVQGRFLGNLEYNLIALLIVIALSIALEVFLSEYLLYRYDHTEAVLESEE